MQKTLVPSMLALFCTVGALAIPALAQHTIFVTPDVATDDPDASGTIFHSWDVLAYHSPAYEPVSVLSLPARTVIDALHKMDAPNDWLISVDVATELPPTSGVVFLAEDIIHYDGSDYTMYFDGSANGVPPGVNVDAVFLIGGDSGDLVISFDKATTIDSTTYESSDLVQFSGGSFSMYFDASASGSGVPRYSDVIGASDDAGGVVLTINVATDLDPSTGPTTYARGDLAQWDGANYSLFETLAGWPPSSKINALSCCLDEDGDIVCSAADNCPSIQNPGQEDVDGDSVGDACDACPNDSQNDIDVDGICGDIDNCPQDPNPSQANIDGDDYGDLCDPCPATPADDCDTDGSTAEEIPAAEGGTVESSDGSLALDIQPNALVEDTTISATALVPGDPEVDLTFGPNPGLGQAVAVFDLQPDGITFDPPATLTIVDDVSEVNPSHFDKLTLYLWTDTDSDGTEDTFVEIPGATCSVENDPAGCDPRDDPPVCHSTATCTAEVDHFSVYALVAPLDSDNDGIADLFGDIQDICPDDPNVIDGFLQPLTDLVPMAEEVPEPDKAVKSNRTLPMKFDYLCGALLVTDQSDVTSPQLLELWRVGEAESLPLVDPDSGEANDSGAWFRYSGEHWIYNLSTKGFVAGTYEVHVKMPDGRVFKGGFVLR